MIDEKKLEERLVALEAAKSWSPRVVSRLETLLRSGPDEALYRINPIQFANEKSIAEAEGIDLFLHACVAGLFDMDWLLVCPMCSDVVESFRSLRKLHTHFHCHLCQSDYDAALDDYITVTFTVSPAVRGIRFHKPEALSAWDYVFHYKLTSGGLMPDGVPWERDRQRAGAGAHPHRTRFDRKPRGRRHRRRCSARISTATPNSFFR